MGGVVRFRSFFLPRVWTGFGIPFFGSRPLGYRYGCAKNVRIFTMFSQGIFWKWCKSFEIFARKVDNRRNFWPYLDDVRNIFMMTLGVLYCITLPKLNMQPENDGFSIWISFSRGWFSGSMLNFRGVLYMSEWHFLRQNSQKLFFRSGPPGCTTEPLI